MGDKTPLEQVKNRRGITHLLRSAARKRAKLEHTAQPLMHLILDLTRSML